MLSKVLCALALSSTALSAPVDISPRLTLVHQFPNGTFAEDLAVRSNGGILVSTNIGADGLWHVDPSLPEGERAKQVTTFGRTSRIGTLGITEVLPDVFAVSNGDANLAALDYTPGSWEIHLVDMTKFNSTTGEGAMVSKVASLSNALVINGLALWNATEGIILATDHLRGVIWRANFLTGGVDILYDDPELKGGIKGEFGANGIKVSGNQVYVSNAWRQSLLRFDGSTRAPGPIQVITQGHWYPEDFAVDTDGSAWVTDIVGSTVSHVTLDGVRTQVAGGHGNPEIRGPSAAAFSRTDPTVLYLTTGGPIAPAIEGYYPEGGMVYAFKKEGLFF